VTGRGSHPCTVLAMLRVRPERTDEFLRRQEEISEAMRRFPGFFGKELIRPVPGLQEEWVSVFRFASTDALRQWLDSDERQRMIAGLEECAEGEGRLQIVAGDDEETPPVAVVFSHRVKAGREEEFRQWRDAVLREMRAWPGFLGADVSDRRPGVQEEWVLVARFESATRLEGWMGSGQRARWVAKLEPLIEDYTAHPLGSGLGGWFNFDDAAPGGAGEPPRWKQILMVTVGLYPTVMLLALFVDPWLAQWLPFPAQMVVANLICVSLLTWPVMPWLNGRFARWLAPAHGRSVVRDMAGAGVVVLVLGLWLTLFLTVWAKKF
jgi:antibiotic biosynthesis monooxygenase (ABM) superfamily enzyme